MRQASLIAGLLATVLTLSCSTTSGFAQEIAEPKTVPAELFPETDPGGHRSTIRAQAFTPDGRSLVTGSEDKTVRIWNLDAGVSRVIRGEVAGDDVGGINAVATSPDGKTLAAGGNFARAPPRGDIRLIDIETGKQLARLPGHARIIRDLAFSPNGRRLASVDSSGVVKVWEVESRRQVLSVAAQNSVRRLSFIDDSTIALAGSDVSVFDIEGRSLARTLDKGRAALDLSVSAAGDRIAVGYQDATVRIWSWPQAEMLWEFKAPASALSVAFGRRVSSDQLAVGIGKKPYSVTVWDTKKKALLGTFTGHDNVVQRVSYSPDGQLIASTGSMANKTELWSPWAPARPKMTLGGKGMAVAATGFLRAPDNSPKAGTYIAWGFQDSCPGVASCPETLGPLSHAFRLPDKRVPTIGTLENVTGNNRVGDGKNSSTVAAYRALLKTRNIGITRRSEQIDDRWPVLELDEPAGKRTLAQRKENRGNDHISYSFDPSGRWVVSGGRNGALDKYLLASPQTPLALVGHDGDVQTVAVSPDGRFILSGGNDQTARLWNSESGELIVSLLHLPEDGRWIMWTPQGYYAAAPNSDTLIGWRVNRGPDTAADFITASELSRHFHNPSVVERAIILGSAKAAIDELRDRGHLSPLNLGDVLSRGLPQVAVISPRNAVNPNLPFSTTVGWTQVTLATFDQPVPIERYTVYVNGTEVIDEPAAGLTDPSGRNVSLSVPLFAGLNQIRIVARNRDLIDREMSVDVVLQATEGPLDRRENAYIVAVGVNGYVAAPRLRYARADAVAFATQMAQRLTKTHNVVHPPILLVESAGPPLPNASAFDVRPPTRANIMAALQSFAAAGKRDTIVLFLAGHGSNRVGPARDFSFLPIDAVKDQNGLTLASVLPWRDIQASLDKALGRKLIFIDACRSSSLYDSGLVTDLVRQSNVVFSSTQPQQDALEGIAFPNGEFTHFLVLGLQGQANKNGGGLTDQELGSFVSDEVAVSTRGLQRPSWNRPLSMPIFDIVRY